MGLIRKNTMMKGYAPLHPAPSYDEIADHLSDCSLAVEQRNAYANALLAWAESVSAAEFSKFRQLVMGSEIANAARDWSSKQPELSVELAVARMYAWMIEITRGVSNKRATGDNFYESWGPNIPSTVNHAYQTLLEGMRTR